MRIQKEMIIRNLVDDFFENEMIDSNHSNKVDPVSSHDHFRLSLFFSLPAGVIFIEGHFVPQYRSFFLYLQG